MKARQFILALATLTTTVASLAPIQARAQVVERTYFTREDVVRCHDTGEDAAIGAGAGAIFGGIVGLLAGGGRALPAVGGALIGAAGGGLLGAGLSCHDEATYVGHIDNYLSQRDYREPYQDDRCRVVVLRSGMNSFGQVCRTYHSEFVTPQGWVSKDTTACWVNGMWRHGYEDTIITDLRYTHPPMSVVEVQLYPVLSYQQRYDHDHDRDFWGGYWVNHERHEEFERWRDHEAAERFDRWRRADRDERFDERREERREDRREDRLEDRHDDRRDHDRQRFAH